MKNAFGKRINPFFLVGRICQTGPIREAYPARSSSLSLHTTALWDPGADMAHQSAPSSLRRPTRQGILPPNPLLVCMRCCRGSCRCRTPSHRPHRLLLLLQSRLTYARCLGPSCPPHAVELSPPLHKRVRCQAAAPPWCPGTSRSVIS
jgi:hypothetical protein